MTQGQPGPQGQQDQQRGQQQGQGRQIPAHLTELTLRGIGQVYDMNLSAARVLLQTQARAASAFGLPDMSGLFNSVDERARHVFSTGAEEFVNTAKRANEVASELQREVGRVVETQTATMAETFKQGLQQLGSQTNEGLNQLVQTTRQQAEEAERVASQLGEDMRNQMQQEGNKARERMQQNGEQGRSDLQRIGEQMGQAAQSGKPGESGQGGSAAGASNQTPSGIIKSSDDTKGRSRTSA